MSEPLCRLDGLADGIGLSGQSGADNPLDGSGRPIQQRPMLELALPELLGSVRGEHESSKLRLLAFHVRERGVAICQEGTSGQVNGTTDESDV